MFRKQLRCRRHVCVLRPKRWCGCDQISIETSCNVALWGSQAILAILISLALVALDDCGGFRDSWTNGFGSSASVPPLDWLGRAWALGAMAKVRVSLSGSWKLPVIMDWLPLMRLEHVRQECEAICRQVQIVQKIEFFKEYHEYIMIIYYEYLSISRIWQSLTFQRIRMLDDPGSAEAAPERSCNHSNHCESLSKVDTPDPVCSLTIYL